MHLRSLRLRGFKSFPDTLELKLEPGVAVVVGPNGSGKSNVADAIVWAAGSLTPSELRAEKPDDVLFAGSVGRFDLPGGDWPTLQESLRLLVERFPPETIVYPGHGPPTTLAEELARNPYLVDLRLERSESAG